MPTHRFTAQWVASLKPQSRQIDYFDTDALGPGRVFGLRVSPAGRKTWVLMYRHNGKKRRVTVGHFPSLTLKDARDEADELAKQLIDGVDLAAKKQAEKRAPKVQALAEQYIEKYAKRHKKSWATDQKILANDVLPLWGELRAQDIRRRDVLDLLDGIVDRGAPILANRTLEVVRKMFSWGLEREIIDTSPCYLVRKPAKERKRDRVLTPTEIRVFWASLQSSRISTPVQIALQLILVTAQRKGEVIHAEKSEFDLQEGWWTIPGDKAKNGLAHRVPLSPLAIQLIEFAWKLSRGSDYLFPSPRGGRPILDTAVDHALRKNRDELGLDHFTPHDLRRTAASQMTSIQIPRLVVSKILNHVESGATAVYDRHSYDKEKRDALNLWASHLREITHPTSNVVALVRHEL